jgi:hypothetical protein
MIVSPPNYADSLVLKRGRIRRKSRRRLCYTGGEEMVRGSIRVNRVALLALCLAAGLWAAELKPETLRAFDAFMATAGRQMAARATPGARFLWSAEHKERLDALLAGKLVIEPWNKKPAQDIPSGMIHDWVGAVFVRGATAAQAETLLQDFGSHQRIYAPQVASCKLLSQSGATFHSSMRMVKKKVITAVLDAEFTTTFINVDARRWQSRIVSTKMVEVADAFTSSEHAKPESDGFGFLWRLNSWWQAEERDGGVVLELRSVSLTRDIPLGLSVIIKPFITGVPRESLESTLIQTKRALEARAGQGS